MRAHHLLALLPILFSLCAQAQSPPPYDNGASNLMVVLRESHGQNKQDETLRRMGKAVAVVDGKKMEVDTGW